MLDKTIQELIKESRIKTAKAIIRLIRLESGYLGYEGAVTELIDEIKEKYVKKN